MCFILLLPSVDGHGDTSMKKLLSIMLNTPVFWATGGTYQLCIQRRVLCKPTTPFNAVMLKGSTLWLPTMLIISFAPLPKVCINLTPLPWSRPV